MLSNPLLPLSFVNLYPDTLQKHLFLHPEPITRRIAKAFFFHRKIQYLQYTSLSIFSKISLYLHTNGYLSMTDSKQQIVLTALKLFLKHSYKEVSLRDIVNEVGLTKGAFYHYYTSKEQLFEEVVRYFYNHVMITDYKSFPRNSFKEFLQHYLTVLQTPHEIDEAEGDTNFFIFISDASKRLSGFKEIHLSQRKKELSAWTDIINTAKNSKEIKSNISGEELARMFLNISDGISMNRAFNRETGEQTINELITEWNNLYKLLKI